MLQKIDTIDFRIKSPIDNLLIVNDSVKFYLKKDILCNLRVVTTNYTELKMKLDEKYKIDNDPREFLDIESLVDAYNEKFQFEEENPEHEVKFIKVVVKRQIDNPIQ